MKTYRIIPLPLTVMDVDSSVYTYRVNVGKIIKAPFYCWYIEGADKKILVDTAADARQATEFSGGLPSRQIATFEEALGGIGLKPEDIDIVIHTHLHWDHCGNTFKCKNAKLIVTETERLFALAPHPILAPIYKKELLVGLDFLVTNGQYEVAPGIDLIPAPGHTPGCAAVGINTEKGKAIITGFCSIKDNFEPPEQVRSITPIITPGIHLDAVQAYNTALRIKGMADILIPIHDTAYLDGKRIP